MMARVMVYWNLHKKLWSIKALEGEHKGRVIAHSDAFTLTDCVFKVSEAGRQRVLREKRKNVHAGVVGTLTSSPDDLDAWDHRPKRQEEPNLEPDEYSDEEADRAEDRWIAERDSFYR